MSTVAAVKPSLTIRRHFKAAPERVFRAWTEPAQIARWFGPRETKVLEAAFDAHSGGRFMIHATLAAGEDLRVSGTVQEAVPNAKLVYTWAWQSTPERESLVTVEFKPDGEGTLLVLTHEQFFDESARDHHNMGWNVCLDRLEACLT
jgi:uncharacterized protein YndB with AHSA1/START domain